MLINGMYTSPTYSYSFTVICVPLREALVSLKVELILHKEALALHREALVPHRMMLMSLLSLIKNEFFLVLMYL